VNESVAGALALLLVTGCGASDAPRARPLASASAAPSASSSAAEDPGLAAIRGKTVVLPGSSLPLRITERAAAKIDEVAEEARADRRMHVRVFRRCAADLVFDPVMPSDRHAVAEGARISGDALSLAFLSGAEIDFVDGPHGAGFRFERPSGAPTCESAGWAAVLEALDEGVGACIATCRDDACRTHCWCSRAALANHVACVSAAGAEESACAGVYTTESALCAVQADTAELDAE